MRVGRDLTGEHHEAGVGQRFGCHAAAGVLFDDRVEDRVRDLVRDLVGMAFGDRFGSKEKVVRHCGHSLKFNWRVANSAEPWRTL
ncbi:hypothetical protein D9M69_496220 [compost metagenome]